jgi:hypothetical protein
MKLCCVKCFQTRLIIDEYCILVLFLSRPAVDRFKKPYLHNITTAGGSPRTLVIHQAPFSTAGFASTGRWLSNKPFPIHTQFQTVCLQSNRMCLFYVNPFVDQPMLHFEWDLLGVTVWDSAIVLAKYMERWPEKVVGKRCIELGSGCGLAGGQ